MDGSVGRLDIGNDILRGLGDASFRTLLPDIERCDLSPGDVLHSAGETPDQLFFPEGGVMSFAFDLPSGRRASFGLVGREGVSSFSIMRPGQPSPVRTVIVAGAFPACRIAREPLKRAFRDHEDLRVALYESLHLLMAQLAYTAMSNGAHSVKERLARWLLLCDDRLDGGAMEVTHVSLAEVLTSQRTTITSLLHVLEGEGAIRNTRGVVRVRDRPRLEAIAGEAYLHASTLPARDRRPAA